MSLFDCIQTAMDSGDMNAERGREAQALFNRLRADYERRIGPDAARAQAAADVKSIMAARAGRKRRLALLTLQAARRNQQHIQNHRTVTGKANPSDALRIFLEGDENSAIQGVRPLYQTLRGFYHGEITSALGTFGRNVVGEVRNKAKLQAVVRELFGEATGDEMAGELATAVRSTLDRARRDFNAAGGSIGELENYGLPMHHDADRIAAAGDFDVWRAEIWDRLDWSRMIDHETDMPFAAEGRTPPRGGRAEIVLRDIHKSILSNGWSRREPAFMQAGLSLANSRSQSRVLHFRSADDWMDYNKRFGSEDPFTTMVTALDGYARDTAAMRVLGPNPSAGLTFLSQSVEKIAQTQPWRDQRGAVDEARVRSARAKTMLDLYSGAAQQPVNGHLANFLAGVRSVLVSAQLGAAAISASTDVGFQAAAARRVGMDNSRLMNRIIGETFGDQRNALRKGLIADQLANVGAAQARYMGEAFTPETAARLSEFVMRISGLTRWTQAGRHAFQLEFMGLLADQAQHSLADMTPALRQVLERKGFTAEEWDVIRAGPMHDEDGATFLVPQMHRHRDDLDPELADDYAFRLMSILHEQTEFAVPSSSLEGQAIFSGQTRPGTFLGELARSGLMYKSFGLSVMFNQSRRAMSFRTTASRMGYAAAMGSLVTLMGAMSLQMKELTKGRDPRPMGSWQFLGAAVLQGGGLGIFGDFLAAEQNRFGDGLAGTLVGPMFGSAGEVVSLGWTGARALAGDDNANVGRQGVRFLRYHTPVTGVWYWSSAFQRGMFDNLQRMVDPEAERAWRRAERQRVRNYGNDSWWTPGESTPHRAPQMGTALETGL